MAAIRQILQRKKAAQNICRITKTMEMISTAKFKSYNRLWQAESDYHNALARAGYLMTTGEAALTASRRMNRMATLRSRRVSKAR